MMRKKEQNIPETKLSIICLGLKISGFTLPNANQLQAKCESLPPNKFA